MYSRLRRKMLKLIFSAILLLVYPWNVSAKTLEIKETSTVLSLPEDEGFENNIIDFDEEYTVKFNKKYGSVPWHANDITKNAHKYTIIKNTDKNNSKDESYSPNNNSFRSKLTEETTTEDFKVIPLELLSTTVDPIISILESTTEQDLTVIPLSTTTKIPNVEIDKTVTLPVSTTSTEYEVTTDYSETTTESTTNYSEEEITSTWEPLHLKLDTNSTVTRNITKSSNKPFQDEIYVETTTENFDRSSNLTNNKYAIIQVPKNNDTISLHGTRIANETDLRAENRSIAINGKEEDADVPVFTELDTEDFGDIPEDYYDSKDVLPTSAPKTDAISVLFGLAGSVVESVVESVAERVVPKSIYDLFKRMQRQNEALEAERLRSREENGGIGQFGRGILKSLSSGLSKPLSQLMAGVKEAGSLDTDRGFVNNLASGVTSVANAANTYLDAFKDKVQAIYPGTVWCGDGHSAQARSSSDLGLFFFTDTCCRQHDACKIYIKAGETKYGLTNTGLFTRSHCSCDAKFRECLRKTNSLVSAQIGLTYFNVLGPQCFRRAHPIVKCTRRTRITGQKCEEYELDYTKPRMWQWFDNETF